MSEIQDKATLEAQALTYVNLGEEIRKLEEQREAIKNNVTNLMKLSEQDEYVFPIDHVFNLKIKVGDRKAKVVDKQELAGDLGVPESSINLEFLLKAVEDKKLTLEQFKRYVHTEFRESISIRKVEAK